MMAYPKACWTTKKEKTLKQLVGILDRWFSIYIRLRDADRNGMCKCITCGKVRHWKEDKQIQCGHFVTRDHKSVRYDEKNCNAQCSECNNYGKGEQYEHGKAIDRRYGNGTADMLRDIGSVRVKLDRMWYEDRIEYYKGQVKLLMKEKGI